MVFCINVLEELPSKLITTYLPENSPHQPDVLVQESPGDELKATLEMCFHCFDVLIHKLSMTNHSVASVERPAFADQLSDASIECPLFVTWQIRSLNQRHASSLDPFQLRGCIGTLSPRPLVSSVGQYALISALNDRRFPPITLPEIPFLRVSVSLLVNYESCEHCHDWTVGVHGIMIQWHDEHEKNYSATYLPEVASEQGWDQVKTVKSLIRKAGYHKSVDDALLEKIQCTRYQSSKQKLTYDEYVQQRDEDPVRLELEQTLRLQPDNDNCSVM